MIIFYLRGDKILYRFLFYIVLHFYISKNVILRPTFFDINVPLMKLFCQQKSRFVYKTNHIPAFILRNAFSICIHYFLWKCISARLMYNWYFSGSKVGIKTENVKNMWEPIFPINGLFNYQSYSIIPTLCIMTEKSWLSMKCLNLFEMGILNIVIFKWKISLFIVSVLLL